MYDKNHCNIVISLQLIKINEKKKRNYRELSDLKVELDVLCINQGKKL